MNVKAARDARIVNRVAGTVEPDPKRKILRAIKYHWDGLNHRQRGRLRKIWSRVSAAYRSRATAPVTAEGMMAALEAHKETT